MGARITTDKYLDKSTLKKIVAKKCEPMFPDKSKSPKKKMVILVEDSERNKLAQDPLIVEKQKSPKIVTIASPDIAEHSSEIYTPQLRKGGYSHMMHELNQKISQQSYVKKNPEYEQRKRRFFN